MTVVGYLAAACSMISFAPQTWKIIRTREVRGLSARTYAVTSVGFALWLVFGVMKWEWPIIITNAVCLALASFILVMKVLPRKKREAVADTLDPASQS